MNQMLIQKEHAHAETAEQLWGITQPDVIFLKSYISIAQSADMG